LNLRQRRVALAFAEALLPEGRILPGAGAATIERLEELLGRAGGGTLRGYGALLDTLEYSTVLRNGGRFSRLSRDERQAALERATAGPWLRRLRLLALGLPLKTAHFDDPEVFRRAGCVYDRSGRPEPARWMRQVRRAAELHEDDLECDVVIVGTGAGGAVVAKELAEAGLAVVMIEEGEYVTREHFTGRARDSMQRLYRGPAETVSIGNALVVIPLGRSVGGSTTINSGTCFRPPDRVLERWRRELGLSELAPERMAPYFEKVEAVLRVTEAKPEYLGGAARVVARGCDRLGWSHHALRRNAPECDGQGVCVFGCPTDAKRSTNISYVPLALERAALLLTGMKAERVLVDGERAAGVEGRAVGTDRRVRIHARAVVLACGALLTPLFLLRQGLLGASRALGRHLTVHPAIGATALFDEDISGHKAIPQGYCVDEFQREGILMEGSSASFDAAASMFNLVGRELVDVIERYDRVACFGAMVCEHDGPGRVRLLPGGRSLTQYWVTEDVRRRMHLAMVRLGRIFFAAGARRVFPAMQGIKEFRCERELDDFAAALPRPRDFMLTAYHPLGTCRIGHDPRSSVVSLDHEAHGLPGLFICDGSVVPTSPTVNPQITIMAMATRAAERIAARIA
jgi:choline dehydrogenase-like flavoprotein